MSLNTALGGATPEWVRSATRCAVEVENGFISWVFLGKEEVAFVFSLDGLRSESQD